jgi:putative two-component system response regulator
MSQAVSRHGASRTRPTARTRGGGSTAPHAASTDSAASLLQALELATLTESASDALVGVSLTGSITNWSVGAERLFGYSHAEAVGMPVAMLAPPALGEETASLIKGIAEGRRIECLETERVTKDGRVLKVQLSISPIFSDDREVAGGVGVYRDFSAQRSAEDALRDSERRYHSVVDALSEGVVMQDRRGRVIAFNKSAERILGLSPEDLAEGSSHEPLVSLIHEDGSPFLCQDQPSIVSMRTGEPQSGVVMGVESPDGSVRWLSINSCALTHPGETKPYAAVSSFTDITESLATMEELHEARLEDLKRLALVSEYRDDDTNRHTERVARTADLLARAVGLDEETVEMIHRAAPLHDVGKIGIPDNILLKRGKLTPEEFEVIKTHPVIGGRILCESRFPILRMATEIAFTHHEHWDGSGYPAGLRGEAIPITGRIVAIADAFDAMTHARPYKSALSIEHAVAEIKRCSGSQFDPGIVEAFLELDHQQLVDAAPGGARAASLGPGRGEDEAA